MIKKTLIMILICILTILLICGCSDMVPSATNDLPAFTHIFTIAPTITPNTTKKPIDERPEIAEILDFVQLKLNNQIMFDIDNDSKNEEIALRTIEKENDPIKSIYTLMEKKYWLRNLF